jgi:dipeptidyl aminopeptidase/acylaminoacyl peptidase
MIAPYGTWPSPITIEVVNRQAVAFGMLVADGEDVVWSESRPSEQGRTAIVRYRAGVRSDVTPVDFNARSRVHEYGGGGFAAHRGVVVAAQFEDQRVWRIAGERVVPVTAEPDRPASIRHADFVFLGGRIVAVQEVHGAAEPDNRIVAFSPDGAGESNVLVEGRDFFSSPRPSPDGTRLAWLAWDHPNMPWMGTELWIGDVAADGSLLDPRLVAGGPSESIFQPEWSPSGELHFVSDRTGWWNLYRWDGASTHPLHPADVEFGAPQWQFGMRRYAFIDADRIACIVDREGRQDLGVLDAEGITWLDTGREVFHSTIAVAGGRIWVVGGGPAEPMAVLAVDPSDGAATVIRTASEADVADYISRPQPITFPTAGGDAVAHAYYYPPHHPRYTAPDGELPPLIVRSHGGPTGVSTMAFDLAVQFWTSRGLAVVDVNYRGSSGFGRAYREALDGEWGIVDTEDCIAAARYLVDQGLVDEHRMAIRGGSAGGYTTLCALTFHDVFAAGTSYFGVADLGLLAEHTHKFESRYLDSMVGPYPESADRYRERSPIYHTARMTAPALVLQGLDDRVVPPEQAEAMVADLDRREIPHAYLAFEGEGHGFRAAENIEAARAAELAFYGEVLGFEPADELPPLELRHRDRL